MNRDRLDWAIKTKQPWPVIQSVEGCSYEEYRRRKLALRYESRARRAVQLSSVKPSGDEK